MPERRLSDAAAAIQLENLHGPQGHATGPNALVSEIFDSGAHRAATRTPATGSVASQAAHAESGGLKTRMAWSAICVVCHLLRAIRMVARSSSSKTKSRWLKYPGRRRLVSAPTQVAR